MSTHAPRHKSRGIDHMIYVAAKSLGTLSKDVFEARTSTGSEAFSLFICLDANKLVLLSFFSLLKTIYPRVSTKSFPSDAKSPLPVDVRRSKTLLLKLPIGLEAKSPRNVVKMKEEMAAFFVSGSVVVLLSL